MKATLIFRVFCAVFIAAFPAFGASESFPLEEAKAHLEAGRYAEAYEPLKLALTQIENPPAAYRRVLASLCLELNKTVEAIEVFRGVALEAEAIESDFLGLFYAYATIGDEKNALAVLSMAHAAGKLDRGSSLSIYSNVLAREGAAYKAAKLLSRAIDEGKIDKTAQNYERAFYAYRQAREGKEALRAIGAAIDLDPSAKLYAQAAHTSFGVGDFGAAIAAAQRAIDLNASRSESLRLLIGAAAIEIKDYVLARSAFAEALKSRRYAKEAKNWLRYLDEITNKGKS